MKTTPILILFAGAVVAATVASAAPKTETECNAEFRANRPKIEGMQSEADFLAACRAGQETMAGATTVARPAVPPGTAAAQPATPPSAAGRATKAPAPK